MRPEYLELHKAHRQHLGVHWDIKDLTDYGLPYFFQSFQRGHGAPKGNGAKALREVIQLADQLGHELTLCTFGERLLKYYREFGFIQEPNDCYVCFMRRPVPADKARRKEPDPVTAIELGKVFGELSALQAQRDGSSSVAYQSN